MKINWYSVAYSKVELPLLLAIGCDVYGMEKDSTMSEAWCFHHQQEADDERDWLRFALPVGHEGPFLEAYTLESYRPRVSKLLSAAALPVDQIRFEKFDAWNQLRVWRALGFYKAIDTASLHAKAYDMRKDFESRVQRDIVRKV